VRYDFDTQPHVHLWDKRSALGPLAGTQDRIAKSLEIRYLASRVGEWDRQMLDAGCGDGETLAFLGTPGSIGFDGSEKMLDLARPKSAEVSWRRHDLLHPIPASWGRFPVVYTERSLINLPDWFSQRLAIGNLKRAVEPGGLLICVECSADALHVLNVMRRSADLPEIVPPSHNVYLRDGSMTGLGFTLHRFSDTYYYLSRIANATLAKAAGKEPDYDSPINRLALEIHNEASLACGQVVAWEWWAPK
jgi:SAM-dependent methyltransferase